MDWNRSRMLRWSPYIKMIISARWNHTDYRKLILDRAVELAIKQNQPFSIDTLHNAIRDNNLSVGMMGMIGENPQAEFMLHFIKQLNQETIEYLQQLKE
jgi:hypothetical protein